LTAVLQEVSAIQDRERQATDARGAQFASAGLRLAAGAEHTPPIVQFGGNVEMHAENEVDPRADDSSMASRLRFLGNTPNAA
jgi:hypothetical protein